MTTTSEMINQDRRRLLGMATASIAVATAASLFPSQLVAASAGDTIRPFRVNIPEAQLADLRRRIAAARWPDQETVDDGSQGPQLGKFQEVMRYWGTAYDWRKVEARLNALPMFLTEIDGVDIHFIHIRSKHEDALPLIVTHGWPGSIIEQLKIYRSTHQSHGARRRCIGRLPSGDPLDARLRLLGPAEGPGLGSRPHRSRLGGVDEAPRLYPLRCPGRRLGLPRFQRDGASGAGRIARHPHQPAGYGSVRRSDGACRRRARAGRALRQGARGVRTRSTRSSRSTAPTAPSWAHGRRRSAMPWRTLRWALRPGSSTTTTVSPRAGSFETMFSTTSRCTG